MSEFINRITAQRDILNILNQSCWQEELFGLSSGAIDRWVTVNRLSITSEVVVLVKLAAEKLFFLANKSQEQVTEDYLSLSNDVSHIMKKIDLAINA
jgi:hypothetical protein